jgi:peptide/nickel transport system ATP-binding protein
MASAVPENLAEVRDLSVTFTGERPIHAVNGLSLELAAGDVLAVLGESGSGKSLYAHSDLQRGRSASSRGAQKR